MKKKAPRKPRHFSNANMYVDFYASNGCRVYVGASCYQNHGQIHLSVKQVILLARYLTKAADWLEYKERERKGE